MSIPRFNIFFSACKILFSNESRCFVGTSEAQTWTSVNLALDVNPMDIDVLKQQLSHSQGVMRSALPVGRRDVYQLLVEWCRDASRQVLV